MDSYISGKIYLYLYIGRADSKLNGNSQLSSLFRVLDIYSKDYKVVPSYRILWYKIPANNLIGESYEESTSFGLFGPFV